MKTKMFTQKIVALGLSTLCIGNPLSDIFKARAVLSREALLSIYDAIKNTSENSSQPTSSKNQEKKQVTESTTQEAPEEKRQTPESTTQEAPEEKRQTPESTTQEAPEEKRQTPESTTQEASQEKEQASNPTTQEAPEEKRQTPESTTQEEIKASSPTTQEEPQIDWEYLRQLDLQKGAVYGKLEILNNIRFYNGFIDGITIKNNARQFSKDHGEGLAAVMTTLFPSENGVFNIGYNVPMTPEIMAKIFGILYMIREKKISIPNNINNYIDEIKDFARTSRKKSLNNAKTSLLDMKKRKNLNKDKLSKIEDYLNNIDLYIKIEDILSTENEHGQVIKKDRKEAFLKLIYDLSIMINEQETNTDTDPNKHPLKKYTAEKVLLGYFVKRFDTKDEIERFYKELLNQIKKSSSEETSQKAKNETLDDIKKLHDVMEKAMPESNIPYSSMPVQHGRAFQTVIDESNSDKPKKYHFDKVKSFADCVDTSVRHIVNLMTYNNHEKKFKLPGTACKESGSDFNALSNAYNSNGESEYKSLKERLHMYYWYQDKQRANSNDDFIRSLWNHVVSNLSCKDENGMYDISYKKEKYELSAGLINVLKVCYNLGYALHDGNNCEEAKAAVDEVISMIDNVFNNSGTFDQEKMKSAIGNAYEKVLKLFNENCEIKATVGDLTIKEKELLNHNQKDAFGTINVSVKKADEEPFTFTIDQVEKHGETTVYFTTKVQLTDDEQKNLLENPDAKLLYESIVRPATSFDAEWYVPDAKEFIEKIDTFNYYSNSVIPYLETHYDQLLSNLQSMSTTYKLCNLDISATEGKNSSKLYKWLCDKILNKQIFDDDFIFWYLINVYPHEELRNENFEKLNKISIKKYEPIKNILKKEKLNIEDVKFLKTLSYSQLKQSEKLTKLIANSDDAVIEEFISSPISCSKEFQAIIQYSTLLEELAAQKNKWSIIEKILETANGLIEPENFILALVEQGKIELIRKYKNKLSIPYWLSENPQFKILDPKIKEELFPDVDALAAKTEPITLEEALSIPWPNLLYYDLLVKCTADLTEEELDSLIKTFNLNEDDINQRFLVAAIANLERAENAGNVEKINEYSSKVRKFLKDNVKFYNQDIDIILKSGNEQLIETFIKSARDKKEYASFDNFRLIAFKYIATLPGMKSIAERINPEMETFQKIQEGNIENISKDADITKFYENQSMLSIALEFLNEQKFEEFLESHLININYTNLIKDIVTRCDISKFFKNFVILLKYIPQDKIDDILKLIPENKVDSLVFYASKLTDSAILKEKLEEYQNFILSNI